MDKKEFEEKYKRAQKYTKEEKELIIKSINTAQSVRFRGERKVLLNSV